jgi:hypothetical protein
MVSTLRKEVQVEPVALAAMVANVLVPALPHLIGQLGEKASEQAEEQLGAEAWDCAKAVWAKLRPRVDASPTASEIVGDVAIDPGDKDLHAAVRSQIKKILSEDPRLRDELTQLVTGSSMRDSTATVVTASGQGAVAAGRDLSGGTIITGDHNRVER